jgi:predicted secreted protein with PEFG-CTERM motif
MKLSRESIDAEKPNGQDETFIILIDDVQVPYEEKETNSLSRLITINFEEGDSDVEIIGTFVVPEFGTITALILVLGVIITIGLTNNKYKVKI